MSEIPRKPYYRLSELCQFTDTQPYVLRFWESEFPQLRPRRGPNGQRVYRKRDIDLVLRIKQLLHDEEYTIADARTKLDEERRDGATARTRPARRRTAPASRTSAEPPRVAPDEVPPESVDSVPRERYDDAVDEIEHLRFRLREAEKRQRKTDAALERAEAALGRGRERIDSAAARIERLIDTLG